MEHDKFKVVYKRKNIALGSALLLLMEFFIILSTLGVENGLQNLLNSFIGILFLGFYPGIMIYFWITRLIMFYVKIEGSIIKARTRFGKKYQFNCREIDRVSCYSDYQRKGGPFHDINMKVNLMGKDVNIYAQSDMTNFSTMAAYILDKYERGEIKQEAISKNCKKMLTRYKNMESKK